MRLVTYMVSGATRYGAVLGEGIVDLSTRLGPHFPTLHALIGRDGLGARA